MIDQNSIENLKQRLDIVDVVGYYLELKKSGASFKAICPFHDDRHPSLHVSPAKGIYHCFVCGAGGDAITFVMEHEKLNYPDAIERLASMYNFSLTYTQNKNDTKPKKILETLELFFQKNLIQNQNATNYLKNRGIFDSSIEKFGLGFAPNSQQTLSFLSQNGFTMSLAQEVGVADMSHDKRAYARFIDRITFPIYEQNGRLVGFGGRTISNHPAKYINSPQTKIFNKSKLLYGYNLAKSEIFKQKKMILVEGYLDVIMLHQAGFSNTVATLGTALTNDHIPLLSKGEPDIILSYDGDEAGIMAAFKAAKMLSISRINGGVVIFSGEKDPADLVRENKIEYLNKQFNTPKPFVEFCLEKIAKSYNLKDPHQKQNALNEGIAYLKELPNLIANSYKGLLADLLNINDGLVKINKKKEKTIDFHDKFEDFFELTIIKTLLLNPKLISKLLDTIDESMFKIHFAEFSALLKNNTDSPLLRRILISDEIKTFSEDELKNAILHLLIGHYQNELLRVKSSKLDFSEKSFLLQKIQNILFRLKKGEMIAYESFSII